MSWSRNILTGDTTLQQSCRGPETSSRATRRYNSHGNPSRGRSRSGLLCSPPSELLGPPPPRQTCLGYCGQECVPVCVKCSLRWECRGRPHCRPRQTDRRRIRRLPSVTAASRAPPIYKKHTSLTTSVHEVAGYPETSARTTDTGGKQRTSRKRRTTCAATRPRF